VKAQILRELPDVAVEAGRTLREMDYAHVRSVREVYPLVIGASELRAPDSLAFMNDFWTSQQQWIAIDASATVPDDADFIAVTRTGGTAPIDYLEGAAALPTYTLTLTEKYRR
jgi:hypothetical protein